MFAPSLTNALVRRRETSDVCANLRQSESIGSETDRGQCPDDRGMTVPQPLLLTQKLGDIGQQEAAMAVARHPPEGQHLVLAQAV